MRAAAYLLVFALGLARPGMVLAQQLITDLSDHTIEITSSFSGARLVLFGVIDSNAPTPDSDDLVELPAQSVSETGSEAGKPDLVVLLRGPKEPIVVRRKEDFHGIWLNRRNVTFDGVYGYYAVLSTRPLEEIAEGFLLALHGIGVDNLAFRPRAEMDRETLLTFHSAIIRNKERKGLFGEYSNAIKFIGGQLFRGELELPASVPVGEYQAEVFLFRDGNLIASQTSPLSVDKIGVERAVYDFAHQQPVIYGLAAILLALSAGWLASVAFRRD